MTTIFRRLLCLRWFVALTLCNVRAARPGGLPEEKPLWPDADFKNPVRYGAPDQVRTHQAAKGSPSGSNRVWSFVAWLKDSGFAE
jgi:hypothetical protein